MIFPLQSQISSNPLSGWSRRDLLERSGLGLGSLALSSLLTDARSVSAAPARREKSVSPLIASAPHHPARAKRIIHLFMNGGPSQFDTFYPKPEVQKLNGKPLPKSISDQLQRTQRNRVGVLFGSPFKFQKYGECGQPVSELFPKVAQHVDELCIVRSMQGEIANHTPGLLLTNCGHSTLARPSLGSWMLYGLGNESDELPGFVVLCPKGLPTAQTTNWRSAFLPGIYQGTHVDIESSGKELIPNLTRNDIRSGSQKAQVALTQFLNRWHKNLRPGDQRLDSRIHSMELAFRMQTAGTDAFDVEKEPQHIRESYGDSVQGRNMLIARRLAERGVRYVQVYHGGGQPWDNHGGLVPRITQLCKDSDQPIAALLSDLKQRGMLEDTLLIWGGEMGRTPTTQSGSKDVNKIGRDHHIDGYTMWMAGGGIRPGMTYGSTDEFGMKVAENKVDLHDLHATILHLMGFDHRRLTHRYAGREFRLTDVHGRIVNEILA